MNSIKLNDAEIWVTWNGGQAVVHGSKLTRLIIDHATEDVRWGFVDRSKAQPFVGYQLTNQSA